MKKILFFAALAVFGLTTMNAQDNIGQTAQGSWLVEANTGFGAPQTKHASTGVHFYSTDGSSTYNFGAEVGYFVIDNLALKLGLGYGGTSVEVGDHRVSSDVLSYKVGAKYYIMGNIPVQIDYSGSDFENTLGESPAYLGLQAGYAFFLGEHLSFEPGVRYDLSMNDQYSDKGIFEINLGFALHF